MSDLFVAALLKVPSCCLVWTVVNRRLPHRPRWLAALVLLLAPAAVLLWMGTLRDSLLPAKWIPWGGVLVLGNPIPEAAAVLMVVARRYGTGALAKNLFTVLLLLIGFLGTLGAMLFPAESHGDYRRDGVVMQTSPATCSAAAAATLLAHWGIDADEPEMVRLCLTTRRGTSMLALYHGLAAKARGTDLRPRVVPFDMEMLRHACEVGPVILSVGVPHGGLADPRYETVWGWQRGVRHAVVLFGFTGDERVEIGDPSVGREVWRVEGLRDLWQGPALMLVPKT